MSWKIIPPLILLIFGCALGQSCGGQWGFCALYGSQSSSSLASLNPYNNSVNYFGPPTPYAFITGGTGYSVSSLFFFVGLSQTRVYNVVALNTTDGTVVTATPIPFSPSGSVVLAYASELGLVVLAGNYKDGSSVVGTVDPHREGSWVQHAKLEGANFTWGGVATYVPHQQEFIFTFASASILYSCALASPGACRSSTLTAGISLASLAFSPQDGQVIGTTDTNLLVSLDPLNLSWFTRGALNSNFTVAAAASPSFLMLGNAQWSSIAWLGSQGSATYLVMSNLCSAGGSPPMNQSTGLPIPLCGKGLGACPLAMGGLFAPPTPPPHPPALDCTFQETYPQQMVVYKLTAGETIDVNGRLDDPAWDEVGWSTDFVDAVTSTRPRLATRVKEGGMTLFYTWVPSCRSPTFVPTSPLPATVLTPIKTSTYMTTMTLRHSLTLMEAATTTRSWKSMQQMQPGTFA